MSFQTVRDRLHLFSWPVSKVSGYVGRNRDEFIFVRYFKVLQYVILTILNWYSHCKSPSFSSIYYLFRHWHLTKAHYSHGAIFRLYFWPCCLYYERTVQRKTGNNWTGERGMGLRNDHEPELKLGSPEALLHNVSESYYFYWNVPMLNSILKALQWGKAGNSALVAHSETCE